MRSIDTDAQFVYNENGLWIQKTVNGVVTKYTLHGKNIVHMTQGGNELHFFYDAQNRPAVVYNGVPYAYVKSLQGQPFRYRGYVFDEETGFYYVSSRYYDPEIGRFISPDTTDVLTATPMGLTDKNLYPRGVRSGIRQLQKYNKDLGGGFNLRLELY